VLCEVDATSVLMRFLRLENAVAWAGRIANSFERVKDATSKDGRQESKELKGEENLDSWAGIVRWSDDTPLCSIRPIYDRTK